MKQQIATHFAKGRKHWVVKWKKYEKRLQRRPTIAKLWTTLKDMLVTVLVGDLLHPDEIESDFAKVFWHAIKADKRMTQLPLPQHQGLKGTMILFFPFIIHVYQTRTIYLIYFLL